MIRRKNKTSLENVLMSLTLIGIEIVSFREVGTHPNKNLVIKFTIPEKVVVDKKYIKKVAGIDIGFSEISQEELINYVKKYIVSIVNADKGSSLPEEQILKHCKFLCKVRNGDIWDAEKTMSKYKEIQSKNPNNMEE
jgi:hypothetical protein